MILIENEKLEITITKQNKEWYINKDYINESNRINSKIIINSVDLYPGSITKVKRICNKCGRIDVVKRCKIKTGKCRSCIAKENGSKYAKPELQICPICGGKKSRKAKVCINCKDTSGENNPMYGKPNLRLPEYNKSRTGEKHPNWKGGVSKRAGKQKYWSDKIKQRDNYKCVICGFDNKLALEAHHIENNESKYWDDKSYDVDFGVTLCSNCHKIFHKTYDYGDNTKEQFEEFKIKIKLENKN